MKRKSADRSYWKRINPHRFAVTEQQRFDGYVTYYFFDDSYGPFVQRFDNTDFTLIDRHYLWMQHFPTNEQFALTTMVNDRGEIQQWYVDICLRHGIDAQGVPWFDDLYLDVIILPNKKYFLVDEDELQQALDDGSITEELFTEAYRITERVIDQLEHHEFPLFTLTEQHIACCPFRPLATKRA